MKTKSLALIPARLYRLDRMSEKPEIDLWDNGKEKLDFQHLALSTYTKKLYVSNGISAIIVPVKVSKAFKNTGVYLIPKDKWTKSLKKREDGTYILSNEFATKQKEDVSIVTNKERKVSCQDIHRIVNSTHKTNETFLDLKNLLHVCAWAGLGKVKVKFPVEEGNFPLILEDSETNIAVAQLKENENENENT